ncbi:DUF4395 domain-containing protein [Falsibacillus pallidus]|uniref:DUF4395 domain-containing protein n=1 Tax=Falsibacillus pallidus TaxID=493781 RepID=UPI003D960194
MKPTTKSIPRPLVLVNQWTIVISVLLTWISGFSFILAIPLAAGLSALVFKYNPIMQLAKPFLKKPMNEYIPEDREQQQFNQKIAVACLTLGLISFLLDWNIAAYIFTAMVGLSAFIAILGFCIGCFIRYQWKKFQHERSVQQH